MERGPSGATYMTLYGDRQDKLMLLDGVIFGGRIRLLRSRPKAFGVSLSLKKSLQESSFIRAFMYVVPGLYHTFVLQYVCGHVRIPRVLYTRGGTWYTFPSCFRSSDSLSFYKKSDIYSIQSYCTCN